MIKLIAIDMDNTLLNDKKEIPESFPDVVRRCREKGICVAIASGRPLYTLKSMFPALLSELAFITDNGGCVEYNGKIVSYEQMDSEHVRSIANTCSILDDCCVIYCAQEYALAEKRKIMDKPYLKQFYKNLVEVDDLTAVNVPVDKVTLYSRHSIETIYNEVLHPNYKNNFEVVLSDTVWADITNKHVNKGRAIERLFKELNIDRSQAMAFGDYYNDTEMLLAVDESYVMENAPLDMRRFGKYVAKSNNEQGVVKAIEQIVLNNPE